MKRGDIADYKATHDVCILRKDIDFHARSREWCIYFAKIKYVARSMIWGAIFLHEKLSKSLFSLFSSWLCWRVRSCAIIFWNAMIFVHNTRTSHRMTILFFIVFWASNISSSRHCSTLDCPIWNMGHDLRSNFSTRKSVQIFFLSLFLVTLLSFEMLWFLFTICAPHINPYFWADLIATEKIPIINFD